MKDNKYSMFTTPNILIVMSLLYALWIFVSESKGTYFIIWNLFLAWIPLIIINIIIKINKNNKFERLVAFKYVLWILWLLFYPNSPYMVTDFIHIIGNRYYQVKRIYLDYKVTNKVFFNDNFKIWIYFVNVAIGVWLGYIVGFVSLNKAHKILLKKYRYLGTWMLIFTINIISGFAIYLGRFVRWNSWDVITDPKNILVILTKNINRKSLYFTILFGGFNFILYLMHYALVKEKSGEEGEEKVEV